MDEDNNNADVNTNQVVTYKDGTVSLSAPDEANKRYIAYVRPGDEIELNFDIKEESSLKVEVVKGDLHIIFANGSTLSIASMAAIGFANNAPKLRTLDGRILSLEEFLSVTEVLNYNEAVLILANRKQVNYAVEEPKIVRVSSDQEADNEAGIPVTGYGDSDIRTNGRPTAVIDPLGISENENAYFGKGTFVSTIFTTNEPFRLDQTNYLPGQTVQKNLPLLEVEVLHGSELKASSNINMNSINYSAYKFSNGLGIINEPENQLVANKIDLSTSSDNIYINNTTDAMRYVFSMNYLKGVFPLVIEIIVPERLKNIVKLESDGTYEFFTIDNPSPGGGLIYRISQLSPSGKMNFIMNFPYEMDITRFDLNYQVQYNNEATGSVEMAFVSNPIAIFPVTEPAHLKTSTGFVLSSVTNPVDVDTGRGNDVIIGGGGDNKIRSSLGNDNVFIYGGKDIVSLGEGDDTIHGSLGNDLIDGGGGVDTIYYDNKNIAIDPEGVNFNVSYYNTYKGSSGVSGYVGVDLVRLTSELGVHEQSSTLDISSMVFKKTQGNDILKNINRVYLTKYNDRIIVSNINRAAGVVFFDGGTLASTARDNDIIVIDDTFVGAVVVLAAAEAESTVQDINGMVINFSHFETVRGGRNNDIFFGTMTTANSIALQYTIDGGAGYDILSYENLTGVGIQFDAGLSSVQKGVSGQSAEIFGIDKISAVEELKGTNQADVIFGSFSGSYIYSDFTEIDILNYDRSVQGVTWIVGSQAINRIYKSVSLGEASNPYINSSILFDSFTSSLIATTRGTNVILTAADDNIIVTDNEGSYNFNAGRGRDTLSYLSLTGGGVSVVFNGQSASVAKGVTVDNVGVVSSTQTGGNDAFAILYSSTSVNIYKIIGTEQNDSFAMDDGINDRLGSHFLDGAAGRDTLSYANILATNLDADGQPTNEGVTIVFGTNISSYVRRPVATSPVDYFSNMEHFIGSRFDDNVRFTAVTTFAQMAGLTFDLGDGRDIVDYSQLSATVSTNVLITFQDNTMIVTYSGGDTSSFLNTEGIRGTDAGNDVFHAIAGLSLLFDGVGGEDTANYSALTENLVFNLHIKTNNNVVKASSPTGFDTVLRTETIFGGTGRNDYYLDYLYSYTINGEASTNDNVSYYNSASGIIYNVATGRVTKGSNTDQLLNIEIVKGSERDDIFLITTDLVAGTYTVFGNDVQINEQGQSISPRSDIDVISFAGFSENVNFTLDTTQAGTYNVYDPNNNGLMIEEGQFVVSFLAYTFNLRHIEGIVGTSGDNNFVIISVAASPASWRINGAGGNDSVDYSSDTNIVSTSTVFSVNTVVRRSYTAVVGTGNVLFTKQDEISDIDTLILSAVDDTVEIAEGWSNNTIRTVNAGAGTDTLSFWGINNDMNILVDTEGSFNMSLTGSTGVLPGFVGFENIRLSSGRSIVVFRDGTTIINPVRIIGNPSLTAVSIADFSALSAGVTLSLATTQFGFDTISGGLTANETMALVNITTVNLTRHNDVVFGSEEKNMIFMGIGGNDTLSYANLNNIVGVTIDWSLARIYKKNITGAFDAFDNFFTTIVGSNLADTFLVTDLSRALTGVSINLKAGGTVNSDITDILHFNVGAGSITFDIFTSIATHGVTSFDASTVSGADVVRFSGDDTVVFSANIANHRYVKYDGFRQDDLRASSTLDFSNIGLSMIYDARGVDSQGTRAARYSTRSPSSTGYSEILWNQSDTAAGTTTDTLFLNFYTIRASNAGTLFYASNIGNFDFQGGTATTDIINYSQLLNPISINLVSRNITKSSNVFDIYNTSIDGIVATSGADTLIIDNIPTAQMNNLSIDGAAGSDTLDFQFNVASLTSITISFLTSGITTVLRKGTTETAINLNLTNFEEYRLTENADTIVIDTSYTSRVVVYGANISATVRDKVNYIGSGNIVFNSQQVSVNRAVLPANTGDTLFNIFDITYSGTGNATFFGSIGTNYTYSGTERAQYNANSVVLSYRQVDTSLRINFALVNNFFSITKGDNGIAGVDLFNSYITTVEGGSGDDVFILSARANTLPSVTLLGGAGNNSVSYENFASGAIFFVDPQGNFQMQGGAGTSGYIIDTESIRSYKLTEGNDTFRGNVGSSISVDGLGGVNMLSYSDAAFDNIDIVANFITDATNNTGFVQKGSSGTDRVANFAGITTAGGDDTITIGNGQRAGTFDAGGGSNTLNATAIDIGMNVTFNANYSSSIAYADSPSTIRTYNGFNIISLGSGNINTVNYLHQSDYENAGNTRPLIFNAVAGKTNTFNFNTATAPRTISVNSNGVGSFSSAVLVRDTSVIPNVDVVRNFMSFNNFNSIRAVNADGTTPSNITLQIRTDAFNSMYYRGGSTVADSINYVDSIGGLVLTFENETQQQIVVTSNSTLALNSRDTLVDIENISLTADRDTLEIGDAIGNYSSSTTANINVDAGEGNDTLSFAQRTTALTINAADVSFSIDRWVLVNFESIALTALNDTATFAPAGSVNIGGGGGHDIADFTASTFTNGVTVTKIGIANILVVDKGTGLDGLQAFEELRLTNNNDFFVYQSNLDTFTSRVFINMRAGIDTVSFSGYSGISGVTFKYNNAELLVDGNSAPENIRYRFLGMDNIVGTALNDTLLIETIPQVAFNFNGGLGVNTIDFSRLTGSANYSLDTYSNSLMQGNTPTKLRFENFTSFIGNSRITEYRLVLSNAQNISSAYNIVTNYSDAIISYANNNAAAIKATLLGVATARSATVVKAQNTDTITNGIGVFVATAFDDVLSFGVASIPGESNIGKTIDINNLDVDAGLNGTSGDVANFYQATQNSVVSITARTNSATVTQGTSVGVFSGFETLNFLNTTTTNVTINLANITSLYQLDLSAGTATEDSLNIVGTTAVDEISLTVILVGDKESIDLSGAITTTTGGTTSMNSILLKFSQIENFSISTPAVMNLLFDNYVTTNLKNISVNDTTNRSNINVSRTSSRITATSTGLDFYNAAQTLVFKTTGFGSITLGNQRDIFIVDTAITASPYAIRAGGSNVGNDTLVVNNGNMVFEGSFITVATSGFFDFTEVELRANNSVLSIYQSFSSTINRIVGNSTSDMNFANNSGVAGEYSVAVSLNLENSTLSVGRNSNIVLVGFDNFILGSANDTVRVTLENTKTVNASAGEDTLIVSGATRSYNLVINNSVATLGTVNYSNFEVFNLIPLGFSNTLYANVDITAIPNSLRIRGAQLISISTPAATTDQFTRGVLNNNSLAFTTPANKTLTIEGTSVVSLANTTTPIRLNVNSIGSVASGGIGEIRAGRAITDAIDFSTISTDHTIIIGAAGRITSSIGSNTFSYSGFESIELGAGVNNVRYTALISSNITFNGAGGIGDTVTSTNSGAHFNIVNGSATRNTLSVNGFTHTYNGFEIFIGTAALSLNIAGDGLVRGKRSIQEVQLSRESDTITISNVDSNLVVDTGQGADKIVLSGEALNYKLEHHTDTLLDVEGKIYHTGGSYIVITNDKGEKMYLLNADLEDILNISSTQYGRNNLIQPEEVNTISATFNPEEENTVYGVQRANYETQQQENQDLDSMKYEDFVKTNEADLSSTIEYDADNFALLAKNTTGEDKVDLVQIIQDSLQGDNNLTLDEKESDLLANNPAEDIQDYSDLLAMEDTQTSEFEISSVYKSEDELKKDDDTTAKHVFDGIINNK